MVGEAYVILTSCIFIGLALRRGGALVLWLNKSFALEGITWTDDLKGGDSHSTTMR